VQAFLTAMPAASLSAMRKGIRSFGPDNQTVIIFESLMDSRSLFLTANSDIRTTELYFVRKEEDGELAARRFQIRAGRRCA
jgi:hypothetical protein